MDSEEKLQKHVVFFSKYMNASRVDFMKRWNQEIEITADPEDFKQVRTIGTGAFGRVILVKHVKSEKPYAMKVMEKESVVKRNQIEHTFNEVKILGALNFEFLMHMEYFFKDNVYLYMVLPFISGGDMYTHLKNMKKFDENLSAFYAAQVILAIEYMHFLGLIYRDLKPENILIDKDGYIKVTDLGFSKKIDKSRTYTLCGTPYYLAPEIILSKSYSFSVDWWSFGVLLYEMNAGIPPFYSDEVMKIYEMIVEGKFNCPSNFSGALKDLLYNMIQVDRSKRYGELKNGSKDIKGHLWFDSTNWEGILLRKCQPPFIPPVQGEDDTSNFGKLIEKPMRVSSKDEFADYFKSLFP